MALSASITNRLIRMNMLVSAVAVVLACAAFFIYGAHNFRRQALNQVSVQAQVIAYEAASPLIFHDPRSAQASLAALRASPHIAAAGIYDRSGALFAAYKQPPQHLMPPFRFQAAPLGGGLGLRGFRAVQPISFQGQRLGAVLIRSDAGVLGSQIRTYLAILAVILACSLLIAYVLARSTQQRITAPIVQLAETAQAVARGNSYSLRAQARATPDEIGSLVAAFNAMLAEIQQRDANLQASERRFHTLADVVPQLAWMADASGAVLWFNQRWYDYTGTNPEQQTGWGWQSSIDPRSLPEVLSQWSNSLRTGKRFEMVYALRARDGSFRDFLAIALPVRSPEGVVEHWFGTNTDITRQRQAEQALRRSEKLAATGRLAASVAHEINNPLAAVTNLLYLACTHPDKAALYASRAATEVDRIAEITKTTLGFYRDTSVPSYVDLADVIRSVVALFQRKLQARSLIVAQRLAPGAIIIGWSGDIRQIFTNLVANAIEASADHATLAIKVSSAHGWANSDGAGVLVSILDHGCGIASSALPKIFEPFYTTKQDVGTGLGLWLTQNLVKKHGGSIRVRSWTSPTQRGTVFSVFLPAAKARHQEAN